mgnify:CR=1 FL=1
MASETRDCMNSAMKAGTATPEILQRARARRRRRALLRPAASLRTQSRSIAPPTPLPGARAPETRIDYSYFPADLVADLWMACGEAESIQARHPGAFLGALSCESAGIMLSSGQATLRATASNVTQVWILYSTRRVRPPTLYRASGARIGELRRTRPALAQ